MKKTKAQNNKQLKELQGKLKTLQAALVKAKQVEGKDDYIDVKVQKKHARFKRIKKKDASDVATGSFFLIVGITAKQGPVFVPVSIATGKKTAGFMYQIEGTAAGTVTATDLKVRGDGVSMVTVGTLLYVKIPTGATALFRIQVGIKGSFGKSYKVLITRINYKLDLNEHRYHQFLKVVNSDSVKFS